MMKSNWRILGLTALTSLLLAGCVVRGPAYGYYGYRRPVVVQETVVSPPPPPVVYQQPVAAPVPVYGAEVVVTAPPPPPPAQVEVVYASPGPGYMWVGGSWVWRGAWIWEPGRWSRPPRRGVIWVPHHYENRGGVHVWISGGWR